MFTCILLVIYSVVEEDSGKMFFPLPLPKSAFLAGRLPACSLKCVLPYLSVSPLPGLQYRCRLLFIPINVGNLLVASKVLKHLLGSHQLEHGLQGLGTGGGEERRRSQRVCREEDREAERWGMKEGAMKGGGQCGCKLWWQHDVYSIRSTRPRNSVLEMHAASNEGQINQREGGHGRLSIPTSVYTSC